MALPVRVGFQHLPMALSCGKAAIEPNLGAERKRSAPLLKEAALRLEALLADVDGRP